MSYRSCPAPFANYECHEASMVVRSIKRSRPRFGTSSTTIRIGGQLLTPKASTKKYTMTTTVGRERGYFLPIEVWEATYKNKAWPGWDK